jgi:hypothetical protein
MLRQRRAIAASIAVSAAAMLAVRTSAAITAEDLISQMRLTESSLQVRHVSVECLQRSVTEEGATQRRTFVWLKADFWTDGKSSALVSEQWMSDRPDQPRDSDKSQLNRIFWDGDTFYEYHATEGEAPGDPYLVRVKGASERAHIINSARLDGPLEGVGLGNALPLSEVLTAAESKQVRPATEKVEGADCHVLEATSSRYGDYTVWLDPQRQFRIGRLRVSKGGDNLDHGRALSASERPRSPKSYVRTVDNVVLDRVGSQWIAKEADIHLVSQLHNGGKYTVQYLFSGSGGDEQRPLFGGRAEEP